MTATVENRPALHLPGLNDEEIVVYAERYGATALEKEMAVRIKKLLDASVYCPQCDACFPVEEGK